MRIREGSEVHENSGELLWKDSGSGTAGTGGEET
jgi:hypothetical protein